MARLSSTDPLGNAKVKNSVGSYSDYGLVTRPIVPLTQFGELATAERTPVIELNSSYGISAVRDVTTVANNGTVTATGGEIRLRTSATASGSAKITSADVGRYIPGFPSQIGHGIRIPTNASGNQSTRWGGLTVDQNDGFYFGQDSTGVFIASKSGGVEENKTYQTSWNIDVVDGTTSSGLTLDLSHGHVFQISFTWYGYGEILFGILEVVNGQQEFVPVHSLRIDGSTSVESPNLSLFAEVDNGGDASSMDVFLGGRQYSIVGKYTANYRFTGQENVSTTTGTAVKPAITFKKKSGFLDRTVKIDGFTVEPSTSDVIVELRLNGVLTSASYGTPTNHTASESAIEVDTAATSITGGVVIYSEFFSAALGNQSIAASRDGINISVPQDQPLSLCVRTLSGSGSAITFLRMREEW